MRSVLCVQCLKGSPVNAMGQSELLYLRDAREATDAPTLKTCLAEGATARSGGVSSACNPYLGPEYQPTGSGCSAGHWFNRCDAWWRGWDAENERRLSAFQGMTTGRHLSPHAVAT